MHFQTLHKQNAVEGDQDVIFGSSYSDHVLKTDGQILFLFITQWNEKGFETWRKSDGNFLWSKQPSTLRWELLVSGKAKG